MSRHPPFPSVPGGRGALRKLALGHLVVDALPDLARDRLAHLLHHVRDQADRPGDDAETLGLQRHEPEVDRDRGDRTGGIDRQGPALPCLRDRLDRVHGLACRAELPGLAGDVEQPLGTRVDRLVLGVADPGQGDPGGQEPLNDLPGDLGARRAGRALGNGVAEHLRCRADASDKDTAQTQQSGGHGGLERFRCAEERHAGSDRTWCLAVLDEGDEERVEHPGLRCCRRRAGEREEGHRAEVDVAEQLTGEVPAVHADLAGRAPAEGRTQGGRCHHSGPW